MHTAVEIAAALTAIWCAYEVGARRGFNQARDIIVPKLDALREHTRSDADRLTQERVQRALLTSVRGGRA